MKKILLILSILMITSVSAQSYDSDLEPEDGKIMNLQLISLGKKGGRATTQIQWNIKNASQPPEYRLKNSAIWRQAGPPLVGTHTYGFNIQTGRAKDRTYQIRMSIHGASRKKVRILQVDNFYRGNDGSTIELDIDIPAWKRGQGKTVFIGKNNVKGTILSVTQDETYGHTTSILEVYLDVPLSDKEGIDLERELQNTLLYVWFKQSI